jgi:two-component system uhpT operon response regulator UhpA
MGAHPEPHEIQVALHGGAHSYVTGEDSVESVILALVEAGNGTDNSHTSENSLAEMPTSRAPSLSDQERTCVALVAAGWQMKQVAFYLGTTVETARGYLKNARAKYSANGIDIGSKMLLRLRAIHDGIISGTE